MKSTTPRLLCLSFALLAGCGEEQKADLKDVGADLKSAGKQAGAELKDAGQKAGDELAKAGASLEAIGEEIGKGLAMKGDEFAAKMKAKLPDVEKMMNDLKAKLEAKGGAFKDLGTAMTPKFDALKARIDELAAAGANASTEVKQAVITAWNEFAAAVTAAKTKLAG